MSEMKERSSRELLQRISAWSEAQPNIRVLILTGSYAQDQADDLSDLDIEIFVRDPETYAQSDSWMSEIGPVWVYLPLHDHAGYPTRLVIFEGGLKVDFSIFPVSVLVNRLAAQRLSPLYDRGYRVLVDKDELAGRLPAPSRKAPMARVPTEEELVGLVREFWFEAYHVAKYLKRGDLWAGKYRDWGLKGLLLRMIE